jgi:hypothetical protein
MLDKLLPQTIDNTYRGYKVALWLLGLVVAVTIIQSVMVIVNGHSILKDADGIPLDTYPTAAAQTIEAIWAQRGLSRLIIASLCVLALVRYRSAVPLMFVVLLLSYLLGQLIFQFVPVVRVGTPPGPTINLIMFVLTVIGLALSLWNRRGRT